MMSLMTDVNRCMGPKLVHKCYCALHPLQEKYTYVVFDKMFGFELGMDAQVAP